MPSRYQDLNYIQTCLWEMDDYLRSDTLLWRLSGSPSLPRLTPGGFLLAFKRLETKSSSPVELTEIRKIAERMDIIRLKQGKDWEKKITQEMPMRLNLWQEFLVDWQESPDAQGDLYSQQVEWRVMISLLSEETVMQPSEQEFLDGLDRVVKSAWLAGEFIWEPEIRSAFPLPGFWYLYGRLTT
jgi:hypothetical protein